MKKVIFTIVTFVFTFYSQAQTLFGSDTSNVYDTVKVVMLLADTSHYFGIQMVYKDCPPGTSPLVSCGEQVKKDIGAPESGLSYWAYGYSVRRKDCCVNGNTSTFAIYTAIPYYTHLFYLDDKKVKLKETLIVWMSVPAK